MVNARLVVRCVGLGAGLSVPFLAGCGDRSEASQATHDASIAIGSIAGGSGSGSFPEYTIEQFKVADTALSKSGLDGTLSEKAGTMVMNAWTELGLASGDHRAITGLEIDLVEQMASIRSALRAWEDYNARALAEEAYDPSREVAALDRELVEIETRMVAARSAKEDVDTRVGALRSQIEALATDAKAEREKAADLELQSVRMTAVQAAEVAPQIQQHALSAEKKLLDIARLEAKVHQLQTEATEATLNFEMFNEQKSLNRQARTDILAARETAQIHAGELRQQASGTANELRNLCEALISYRDGKGAQESINELFSTQIGRLRAGLSNARQGSNDMKTESQIASASAHMALAGALTNKARSFADFAGAFGRVADATPSLPDGSWFSTQASNARGVSEAAASEAKEAYQDAARDFQSVRVTGEANDLIQVLVEQLKARAGEPEPDTSEDSGNEPTDE